MKLNQLTLRSFKGIEDLTLDILGNVNIYGENATGKTTIFDAFTWLLFDKDSLNRKDFEIKPLSQSGDPMHGMESEVAATIEIDGNPVTLRKVYSEKWTKKRGSPEKEFTGHETQYYIDGVPVQKKEYESRIASTIAEERFKLLTNPRHFNEVMHWQDRRRILLEVCGDVSDADVIASNEKLAELPAILGNHNLEDYRKIIKARHTEINKELTQIPVRIDEATRSLPDKTEIDVDAITNEIDRLEQQRAASLATTPHRARGDILNDIERARAILGVDFPAIRKYDEELQRLRKDWESANAEVFTAGNCPTCGQPMPEDKIEQFEIAFLFNKNQRLASTRLQGEQIKGRKQRLEQESEDKRHEVEKLEQELNSTSEPVDVSDIQAQIDQLRAKVLSAKQRETMLARIEELDAQEKMLGKEYVKLNGELFLTEEFIRTKVSMLDDRINSRFSMAKFKLFDVQVNEAVAPCCETTYQGVPYGSLNNSARLNIGLDIINTLSDYYGMTAPIFVDNAEAVVKLLPTQGQQIRLYVSEGDRGLRIKNG